MFQHEFLDADIDLPGILGLDFLEQYDIVIKISSGTLQIGDKSIELERNDSEKCARVKLSKRVGVPPEFEMVVKAYVKGGHLVSDSEVMLEPYKVLGTKGLLVSNSIVEPNNVLCSVINVTKKPVIVKQHTLVGSLTPVDNIKHFQSIDDEKASIPTGPNQVQQHLQPLLDSASETLTNEQQESLSALLIEFQDIFMGPDGKLGRTDLVKHTYYTGNAKPIEIPPRRVPQNKNKQLKKKLTVCLKMIS